MRKLILCLFLLPLAACSSKADRYAYTLTNQCVKDYVSKHYKVRDEVPYIEIIENNNNCKQYYISSIAYVSYVTNNPPCYYATIDNKMVLIYTKNCLNKDTLGRSSFFVNKFKNRLQDDVTKQPDRYIDGYKIITVHDFFDPSNVRISECGDAGCAPVFVEKMP
ncbi:hypothetical protein CDA63_12525 [Hymenobacter amundsenii]|uniref:Lipoprotein n=1 Tax=Hymenobacter amundsenii TaxID=2006685 RepID=A0A246FJK0_9BACT|nr:hypothetical protein CDA63_12525 [Hymenobacter amundsenii]